MRYWLMKSEPDVYSIEHLSKEKNKIGEWNGVRNYQARNMLRDEMKSGDLAFFYHSNCQPPGIVGIVEIVREGYPDYSSFDPVSPYFDPKSNQQNPRWYMVDIKFVKKFKHIIPLASLRAHPKLADMILLRKGNRLSITPVTAKQWQIIAEIGS